MKIGMISLGCDKNRVDSEKMLFALKNAGYIPTEDENDAEVIIINSCAFIDKAKEETIDTVFETAELKNTGKLKYLVLTGCFAQRYAESKAELPEVDLFVDIREERDIVAKLDALTGRNSIAEKKQADGRIVTTPAHYAYLKIAEGCDNRCSYCAIPYIRGRYVSTPVEDLVNEAKDLADGGVKELILVAQDVTNYGKDLYGKPSLIALLQELIKLDVWKIRILYAYPELITDELLDFIKNNDKVAKYLDIPMQHADSALLKKMNRKNTEPVSALIARIRQKIPDIALRSGFICGFPYETEAEHERLIDFLSNGVDYGGFFAVSPEEGTPAYNWTERADKRTVKRWVNECEDRQTRFTLSRQKRFVGRIMDVIYEGIDYDKQMFVGRTEYNAPDIDTKVYFFSDFPLEVGKVVKVKIEDSDFHLYGSTVTEVI